jgi:hypothetical protein
VWVQEAWPHFRGSLRFLLIGLWASLAAVAPVRAVEPVTAAPAGRLADGIWMVQARVTPGSRHCNDRLVRLTNRQGRLSGVVAFARASVPIEQACLYRILCCCRTGASRELHEPVWQARDSPAFTKLLGSFRGTRSALPLKITSVLLATAWPLEKREAAKAEVSATRPGRVSQLS